MDKKTRNTINPQDYILQLYNETFDGKLAIKHYSFFDGDYTDKYEMDWNRDDALELVERYKKLVNALTRIGKMHDKLNDEEARYKLLSLEEYEVWDTYIRPFSEFDWDLDYVSQLQFRRETETLEDEEYEILERHYEWFVANSRERMPFDRCCPAKLINCAINYEDLIKSGAPESAIEEQGRCLAEEMVVYYHSKKEIAYDLLRFLLVQMKDYPKALEEIKNGKKKTHWMWYIFPQLRGLAQSEKSYKYGIVDIFEAQEYLENKPLRENLIEISTALLLLEDNDPVKIFGDIDAKKLQSSMTLFALISKKDSVFTKVLEKYYNGEMDEKTKKLLSL